ncbi:MAG: response regulator [Labilithrix sp.]|nr:response regulator [Labilithrix sp.]MCW5831621.1 response regulator [Labilithrix sp.]
MVGSNDASRPLRAIVVEDEADDALLLLRELKRSFDAHCVHVSTPEGLREALARGPWDIVISDWALPTFNGLQAFGIVREVAGDLPFIIVSGTITEEAAVEALKAGVHDFMVKGRFARLAPAIERELREAETRREKRLAELDLERQRAETERSERLLRSVLQAVPDGVVVVDTAGRIVVWSAGADAVFKMPRADIELADWPRHYGIYLPDRATLADGADQALVKALAGTEVDREERCLRNAHVKDAWLSVSARPLRASDGSITGAVGVFRDVTPERSAQEQVMISDRMASVGMLAAGVAHEINNPLGAALLNLELLHEMLRREPERRDDAELRATTADARSAVARVREIVSDLRIFSRHEDPTARQADVRSALESSLRMAFNEVRHRARVVKDYQPVPVVDGSEARLGQVFLNLIVNAAQAIPEGNLDANTIRVAARTDAEGRAVVEVSDTGAGISAETLPNLFTPFFTTKPPGIGTGLGLPICRRIVAQMGGEIQVESVVGEGTTFRVVLPAARAAGAQRAREETPARAPVSQRRGRILVVDDEPMLGSAIRRVLSSQHDVVTTTRAVEALERLRAGATFDVIFSDLMMPQVTGMELYVRIREEFPEHAPRVVFLTGGAFTQAARDFLARVPNPTLEKPIDRNGLLALVSERVKAPSHAPPKPGT